MEPKKAKKMEDVGPMNHKYDHCKLLRKKFPCCIYCGEKLINGKEVIGIHDNKLPKGETGIEHIIGSLCSVNCYNKYIEERPWL